MYHTNCMIEMVIRTGVVWSRGRLPIYMPLLLLLLSLCFASADKGFPLYFSSFEDVGSSEIINEVLSPDTVDFKITKLTQNCPADAFVIIEDEDLFKHNGIDQLDRLAQQSLTRCSYLSSQLLDLKDFADDLADYCDAEYMEIDYLNMDIEPYLDTKQRVIYVKFPSETPLHYKSEVIRNIIGIIPTPFITTIYTSSKQVDKPIMSTIKLDARREGWQRRKFRRDGQRIAPIIAPIMGSRPKHPAAEEVHAIDLPDHFFTTLFIGSLAFVGVLAYRDYLHHRAKQSRNVESKKG